MSTASNQRKLAFGPIVKLGISPNTYSRAVLMLHMCSGLGREEEPWRFMLYRQYFYLDEGTTWYSDVEVFEIPEPGTKKEQGTALLRATSAFNSIVLSHAMGFPLAGAAKERECLELDADPYRLHIKVDGRVRELLRRCRSMLGDLEHDMPHDELIDTFTNVREEIDDLIGPVVE
jgi:hypothetical protein